MPHPLQQRVAQVREAWNRRVRGEAVAWFVAVLVAIVLSAGLVDYLVRSSERGFRVLLSAAAVAGAIALAVRLLRWARRQWWSEARAAQAVQRQFPALGDRVASALEFLSQDEDDATAGSAPMRRAVVTNATAELQQTPVEQVALRPQGKRAMLAAAAAVILAAATAVLAPAAVRTACARLVAPWNDVEWPRQHNLEFVDAPTLLARGDAFEASLIDSAESLPEEVTFEVRYEVDGRRRQEQIWMQRVGDRMVARRDNVRRSFEYRATGGDHRTMQWTKVEVVDRPTAERLQLAITPPAYSGLPTTRATGNVRVWSGSTIGLTAKVIGNVSTAELQLGDDSRLPVRVVGDRLELDSDTWQVTADARNTVLQPQLHLRSKQGVAGRVALPSIEVVADAPPKLSWDRPLGDLAVLAGAAVPVAVEVTDDLAIATATLVVQPSRSAEAEQAPPMDVPLLSAGDTPPTRDGLPQPRQMLDRRQLATTIDLAAYNLAAGDVVELTAKADDYVPQPGRTSSPRRLTIITPAELDSQLAESQAAILRLLEQALADERAARDRASTVANQLTGAASVDRGAIDQLVSSRLVQEGVRRTLVGDESSVTALARSILDRLKINRLDLPELAKRLEQIVSAVEQLGGGPLPAAEQQLTAARKTLESQLGQAASSNGGEQLAAVRETQTEIVAVLESLVDRAAAWSDADRFVRELARLEQLERELRDRSVQAMQQNLRAATDRKVDPVSRTELEQLAAAQADVARQFDKLMQSMQQMAASEATTTDIQDRLNAALEAASEMNLAAELAAAARELGESQLGRAADTQQSAADALRELVERLRDRAPSDPGELAARLRQLQQQLAEAKQQADEVQQNANPLRQPQQRQALADQLERLARELARLTASAASQSTQSASQNASPKPGQSPDEAQQDLAQSQQDIEQAQQQLNQRIAELEGERQQRLLDRLAQVLETLIPEQQQTLQRTLQLELVRESRGTLPPDEAAATRQLSADEVELADQLNDAIADVERRAVFQLALGGAASDMQQAARALAELETGRVTQSLELSALSRMRHVLDILREPPPQPSESPPSEEGSGGGGGEGGQPQQPPLIELAEVKMLRWLQLDLNQRTRLFESDLADNARIADEKREAARRLAAEQRELEELVRQMMRRNNRNMQPEVDL